MVSIATTRSQSQPENALMSIAMRSQSQPQNALMSIATMRSPQQTALIPTTERVDVLGVVLAAGVAAALLLASLLRLQAVNAGT